MKLVCCNVPIIKNAMFEMPLTPSGLRQLVRLASGLVDFSRDDFPP